MKESRVKIDGTDYTIEVEDDEVVDIYETESFRDTEAFALQQEMQKSPNTTAGNFHVHAYKGSLKDVLVVIGEYMNNSDLEIVRIDESKYGEDCVLIEWEQPSAMGLYDTPEKEQANNRGTALREVQ